MEAGKDSRRTGRKNSEEEMKSGTLIGGTTDVVLEAAADDSRLKKPTS